MRTTYLRIALACSLLISMVGSTSAQNLTPARAQNSFPQLRALYSYTPRQGLNVKVVRRETSPETITEYITFRGQRDAHVPAYIVLPRNARAARPVPGIVLLHGRGGGIEQMQPIAAYLAALGYASLIPEIVDHGARRDPKNPMLGGDPARLRSGMIESVQDVRRAMDIFVTRREVDKRRIGLVGLSLGAILGSITTAVDTRIATCVLIVGGADWRLILSGATNTTPSTSRTSAPGARALSLLNAVDPKNFVGHIAPRPVLMLNGRRDTIIPVAAAQALFNAAKKPKKQIWFDTGHALPPLQVAGPLRQWLDEKLKPRPAVASSLSP